MLRRFIPRKMLTLARFYTIFNHRYGHSRFKNGFCVDGEGNYIPWITYPCIEFLNTLDLRDCRVFEFGSGSSTLYWAQKTKSVTSVERDRKWYDKVTSFLPSNCVLQHCGDEMLYPTAVSNYEGDFDILVVDGAVRYPCVLEALKKVSGEGIIILDNTEWYPNTAEMLRDQGYLQIDFCGFSPINAFTSCTSIFFKSPKLLSRRVNTREWRPQGGRYLTAHDDKPLAEIDPACLVRS